MVAAMTPKADDPLGAILVGGASSRMGADKAGVRVAGKSMLEMVAAALEEAGCEVVAVGKAQPTADVRTVPDDGAAELGPAAGLATALRLAGGRPVFLVATDQPLLQAGTVRSLLAIDGTAVVPIDNGVRQATCGVYRAGCEAPLRRLRSQGASPPLQRLLDAVGAREVGLDEWAAWGEDGRSWWSLDRPEDVAEAEAWLRTRKDERA